MYRSIFLTLVCLCATAGSSLAEPIPWRYDVNVVPSHGTTPLGGTIGQSGGGSGIHEGSTNNFEPYSYYVLQAEENPGRVFEPGEFPITFDFTLTDLNSGEVGSLVFEGYFRGNPYDTGTVLPFFSELGHENAQSITLGGNRYDLWWSGLSSTPVEGLKGPAGVWFSAHVEPDVVETPEPASLTLIGLGLASAGLVHLRRRLRRRPECGSSSVG